MTEVESRYMLAGKHLTASQWIRNMSDDAADDDDGESKVRASYEGVYEEYRYSSTHS